MEEAKLSRRSFLKLAAIAAAALGAGSSVVGGAVTPPFARARKRYSLGEIGGKNLYEVKVTPAICPYCSIGCSIDIYTDGNGRVVFARGSTDSYINSGRLCPKGKAAFQIGDNKLRVLWPMIRTGPKPPVEEILSARSYDELVQVVKRYPPSWRPVDWSEAFNYIAQKLKTIMDDYRGRTGAPKYKDGYYYKGSEVPVQVIGTSIIPNEAAYLSKKLAMFLGTSNHDSQYRKCHSSTVSGLAATYGWGAETATIEDVALADVVLFLSNPAEAHPVSFQYFMRAKKKGAKFIVADPRLSRTALYADLWLPFRSGTEVAILWYFLYYAFFERNPPIDQLPEFNRLMARWNIGKTDLEDFKEVIREYDANTVSRITGVPVDKLKTAAAWFVENSGVVTEHKKHGIIQWAMGVTQHTNATVNIIRAAAIVQLLLGNVGYPGGGTHPFRGHSNVQGATDVQFSPGGLPGYPELPTSTFVLRVYQDWKLQGMPDAWEWEVPSWARDKPPFNAITKPNRGEADLAKAVRVWIFDGWRRLELTWGIFLGTIPEEDPVNGVVVSDLPIGAGSSETTFPRRALAGEIKAAIIFGENVAVANPNAKIVFAGLASLDLLVVSDLFETETAWFADVLLPAAAWFEREGTITNTGRVIQWSYKAREPLGLARPDYWIIAKLYNSLRANGVVRLPSEYAGVKKEKVQFRKKGRIVFVWERELKPDKSWDYSGGSGAATPVSPLEAEVNPRLITRELNFSMLIYQGVWDPVRDEFTPMRRSTRFRGSTEIDGEFSRAFGVYKDWGWSWPMNIRFLYNYDSLKQVLGREATVKAAGREWVVTGETGEIIDEYTGEYRPFAVPGHNFHIPKVFKRRLSGIADLFGGVDLVEFIRTGKPDVVGKFVVEEDGEVKAYSFEEFATKTGMKYLWANDTRYIDDTVQAIVKAGVKVVWFAGSPYKQAKPTLEAFKQDLKKFYQETGDLLEAVKKVIEKYGRWYPGYNFQWPLHTEPAESPLVELQLEYPTLAWMHPYNLMVLYGQPDIVKGKQVGIAYEPKVLAGEEGELVVLTTHRMTETWHTGALSRNIPYLLELVPDAYVQIPRKLADKLGVKSGDYVEIVTARGVLRMKAWVTEGIAYLKVNGVELPVASIQWSFSFAGAKSGPEGNYAVPDVVDVVTTIQESKAFIGKIRKPR